MYRPDFMDDAPGNRRLKSCWFGYNEDKRMWKELCKNIQQESEPLIVFHEHPHLIESLQKADSR